ncbi:MAG: UDP-3-O-(3-hydroxymyristoyl)glucosamine N-acyltransferase [Thiobacillus sp.]
MSVTLTELVARFGGELVGDGSQRISQVAPLDRAAGGDIGFVSQTKYLSQLANTRAAALILPLEARDASARPRILTANPYLYFARVSALLNPPVRPPVGVHPAATVAADAQIAADASVAAGVVIGSGVQVGARTLIGANCTLGDGVRVGEDCVLHSNVSLYSQCQIGDRAILHSGCVIGADGFGFAPDEGRWEKIPQIGRVRIGNDVEVGACTTIDRGALEDTVIEDGVKLDNQIQIAHNVVIGAHTAIAACTGIAGSAKIGRHCTIGGAAMIIGHINIADGTHISTNTLITKSLTQSGSYTSALPFSDHASWQKNAVHMRNLDKLVMRIKQLEKRLSELESKS